MAADPIRTLIVREDAEQTATALSSEHDLATTTATSQTGALDRLAAEDVDCIVTDEALPDASGLAVLETARERHGDLPGVVLLDPADEAGIRRAIAADGVDYLLAFDDSESARARLADRIERAFESHRARRAIEHERERLETFASVVSHDLRNPLNVAQSSVELIRADADSDHLDRIERSLTRMNDIIDDVVTLARQGDTAEALSPIDLETMARDAWSLTETGDLELVVEGTVRIEAGAERLQTLLSKLFENALAHGDATTVTVGLLSGTDGGDFYVEDNGEPIPESDRETVFEAGFSTARAGTGLGLSIVREIAQSFGWSVTVTESTAGGTRFEFTGVTIR